MKINSTSFFKCIMNYKNYQWYNTLCHIIFCSIFHNLVLLPIQMQAHNHNFLP